MKTHYLLIIYVIGFILFYSILSFFNVDEKLFFYFDNENNTNKIKK